MEKRSKRIGGVGREVDGEHQAGQSSGVHMGDVREKWKEERREVENSSQLFRGYAEKYSLVPCRCILENEN